MKQKLTVYIYNFRSKR